MRIPASAHRGVGLIAALCGACGGNGPPYRISGQVVLATDVDGGTEVRVSANVTLPLDDGGVEDVLDAGVALNGVALGSPTFDPSLPTRMTWTRPSLAGAIPLARQTLSVAGSNASVSFDCPEDIRFASPPQRATVDRNAPIDLSWTPRGSPLSFQILTLQMIGQSTPSGTPILFGFQLIPPGVALLQLTIPPEAPATASLHLDLTVNGDPSEDGLSYCASTPALVLAVP